MFAFAAFTLRNSSTPSPAAPATRAAAKAPGARISPQSRMREAFRIGTNQSFLPNYALNERLVRTFLSYGGASPADPDRRSAARRRCRRVGSRPAPDAVDPLGRARRERRARRDPLRRRRVDRAAALPDGCGPGRVA